MMARETLLRAERVERAALADLHRVAPAGSRARLGLSLRVVDNALVSIAGSSATILANRTVGLGVSHPAEPEALDAIIAHYRRAGVERYFVHLDPAAAPTQLVDWMMAGGLEPYRRAWAKFVRGIEPPPPAQSELEVREAERGTALDFGRIAAAGFGLEDEWIRVLAQLVGRDGWRIYLSFDGDEPAGCGAFRMVDGVAWFDWAATLPAFRRRGSQSALLARRIADALESGCDLLVTATGEAVEGDAQHSFRNIERLGFRRTHARANWVPAVEGPGAGRDPAGLPWRDD